ncbi:hypothetical protein DFR26_0531 [Paraperlucidibaca baekdonensis]|uniref:DNA-binding protein n=1 Tax=Paraperlucidibaca baekdonensis TaxID=748120 RepID=A0A3E0H9E1_9GAMM|nr:hypothetical protein [Paraperlucidibaca baekdonensis]REH40331.1 hypothetical protein DFR26_0531 [Paraperlucidibaca baekdonensis]
MHKSISLLEKYGPLMTVDDLAELLTRVPTGLRASLNQKSKVADIFNPTRLKIGRKSFFRTHQIIEVLQLEEPAQ